MAQQVWHRGGFSLLLVLLVSLLCYKGTLAQLTEINYAFMSSGGGGFESSGSLPAIELAEETIRANSSILADYNLTHTAPLDSQCDSIVSLNQFFQSVPSSDPPVLALLGSGCSVATEPVAQIIHFWNISQISYASSSIILNERARFPSFFRTGTSDDSIVPAIRSVIEFYGWRRVMFFTQEENLFLETFTSLSMKLMDLNITVARRMIPTQSPFQQLPPDIFNDDQDFRVIFINAYSDLARVIVCEAAKLNLTYPRYAWLTYGWYQGRWWTDSANPNPSVNCTDQQLEMFLERSLALQVLPSAQDPNAPTDTGLSAAEFYRLYDERLTTSRFNYTYVSTLAYDATWALAIALDRTARMVNLSEADVELMTNCSATGPGSGLVPLEDFTYANSFMGCVIQWNLARTKFVGVTGPVSFDDVGTRVPIQAIVSQYRTSDTPGSIDRVKIGFVDSTDSQFSYVNNESDTTIYPDGVPPDGTPVDQIITFHLAFVITYDIIAFLGLIFTTVCLVFNFAYRKRKTIRLTSPNLNYFIIAGSYLIYSSIYFRLIPTTNVGITTAQCHLQSWLSTLGYTLAFSTVLSKMIRVYHIFHNPTTKKKSLKDWHLVIIILSITSISVILLVLGSAVPQLRPVPSLAPNEENPIGEDELGVRINYVSWDCYSTNFNSFIWLIIIFVYLALQQLVGFILAVQTRKVKIKALNDSKYVAAIIYVSSIVLVVLALVTFTLGDYVNLTEVFFSGGLIVGTTAFIGFSFIPKMVSLYRDPYGENVFDKTNPASTVEVGRSGAIGIRTKSAEGEKITLLENKVKELQNELAVVKRRNTAATNASNTNQPGGNNTTVSVSVEGVLLQSPATASDPRTGEEPASLAPPLYQGGDSNSDTSWTEM